jgi:hypothetical protein
MQSARNATGRINAFHSGSSPCLIYPYYLTVIGSRISSESLHTRRRSDNINLVLIVDDLLVITAFLSFLLADRGAFLLLVDDEASP